MLELNKYGFHVFQYKVISVSNYKRNYSTQTLSSNSSLVAEISCQVMKHNNELENRPQMVSISKLYLNLRKKLLFVSVLPIEKARSHHMTLGTEVTLTGFHEFCAIFRRDTN